MVCQHLSQTASSQGVAAASTHGTAAVVQAAAAGECLEALDAALPATVADLVCLIGRQLDDGSDGAFAARQLLLVAARCVDFTDGQGRLAAEGLVERLVQAPAEDGAAMAEAVEGLCRQVYSCVGDLLAMLLWAVDVAAPLNDGAGTGNWLVALGAMASALRQWPDTPREAAGVPPLVMEQLENAVDSIAVAALESEDERVR